MTDHHLISVVTTVYNDARYLPELIESVLAQDYPHYEHIIVEGGSTDDGATVAVLEQYSHLRWWTMAGSTAYEAQKAGMAEAKGDFIVLINADDKFITPNAFSIAVEYLQKHPQCDLVYGKTAYMDENSDPLPDIGIHPAPSKWLLRHIMYMMHCSTFISRKLIIDQKIELEPALTLAADWDWMIRLFDASAQIGYIKAPLSVFRTHHGQRSYKAKAQTWINEKHLIVQSHGGHYWLHQIIESCLLQRRRVIMGVWVLRRRGIGAFLRRIRTWLAARLGK